MVDTHILLVVDDSEHQRLLTRVLTHERSNVQVTAACLGVQFMRALNSRKYDCIILDCNSPDRPADELLAALNDHLAHCPVVVISGLKRHDVNVSCTRADSIDFISREAVFITDELWMRVQEAMRHQEQRLRERRGYERRNRYLARLAETDALTGLSNRHYLNRCLRMGRWHSDRRQSLACILIDIDRFKTINDTFGHSTGDDVLKMVASVVQEQIKPDDVALRWGGEEILIMRPSQNLSEAWVWAEKLRQRIGSQSIERDGRRIAVTVCIGLAFSDPRLSDAQLFEAADSAMYLAKRRGRNTICTAAMAFISRQIDSIIISTHDIEQRRGELLRHLASQLGPVQWQYVDHHCGQVSTLVERIAQNLHLPAPTVDQVRLAGLLHDLGK